MTMIQPLRLAVGSHKAGSGKGCGMNVVSWENGDTTITAFPDCADPFLARVVHRVNDLLCTHRGGTDLLCPPCSLAVLALAHRTVGTTLAWPPVQRARLYAELAVEQAESVLHLAEDDLPRRACVLARRFLAGEAVTSLELANAAARVAEDAAYYATYAAYQIAAYYATDATDAAIAEDAATDAADAVAAATHATLSGAHHVIDRFEALTGVRAQPTPAETTARAIAAMTAT